MKRISKFVVIGAGALLIVGGFSACSHKYRGPEHRAQWMVEKISKELDLTEAQQARLNNLSSEMLSTRQAMKQQFGDNHQQGLDLFTQPKLDQAKVLGMIRSHTQAINDRAPQMVSAMGDFYDSLTTEQQAKMHEHMQKFQGRNGHWGHHGDDHGAAHHGE